MGGYTIIDFGGKTLVQDGGVTLIKGIYKQCERALRTNKSVLCSNVVLVSDDDTCSSKNDFMSSIDFDNDGVANLYVLFYTTIMKININTDDSVSLISML